MGKHYKDPKDKPTLLDNHTNPDDKMPSGWHNLFDLCDALAANPYDGEGAERLLYAVQVPRNLMTDKDQHCRYYLSWHGAQAFLAKHNETRVNKQNMGNKRKARMLVYTMHEVREYLSGFIPQGVKHATGN